MAAVAVLIAGSVLLGPSSAAPTAVHPTPTTPAPPTVPGISPSQAERIVELCGAGYSGAEPGPGLELYNAIRSPWGMRYLLYGPNTYISCLHPTEGDWRARARGEDGPTQWLRGPIAVDWSITDGLVPYDKGPGVFSAEGRAASSVASIRVTHGSSAVTVPAVNGTSRSRCPSRPRHSGPARSASAVRRRRPPTGLAGAVDRRRRSDRAAGDLLGHPGGHCPSDDPSDSARAEVQARDPVAVSQPAGAVSPGVCSSAGSTGTTSVSPLDR